MVDLFGKQDKGYDKVPVLRFPALYLDILAGGVAGGGLKTPATVLYSDTNQLAILVIHGYSFDKGQPVAAGDGRPSEYKFFRVKSHDLYGFPIFEGDIFNKITWDTRLSVTHDELDERFIFAAQEVVLGMEKIDAFLLEEGDIAHSSQLAGLGVVDLSKVRTSSSVPGSVTSFSTAYGKGENNARPSS